MCHVIIFTKRFCVFNKSFLFRWILTPDTIEPRQVIKVVNEFSYTLPMLPIVLLSLLLPICVNSFSG